MKVKIYGVFGRLVYENVRRMYSKQRSYHIVKKRTEITVQKANVTNFEIMQEEL